jgi:hypothetical protein
VQGINWAFAVLDILELLGCVQFGLERSDDEPTARIVLLILQSCSVGQGMTRREIVLLQIANV